MRAPATRDQADAYRFGLRRMEAALVRGDPVPLHEQIRAQRRATIAGALLGLLALCGVAAYAVVVPRPDWRAQAVVLGAGSGAMYAVAHEPDRLVPVADLVAARLVLGALRSAGATDADPAAAVPVPVPDDMLATAPRTPAVAVPGVAGIGPSGVAPAPRWAVCDQAGPDGRIRMTTVLGGAAARPPASLTDGVLLTGPDEDAWLLTAGRRHRLDQRDGRLLAAYGLARAAPREVSGALLGLLPEGPALVTPGVAGLGGPAPRGLPGRIGDVLQTRPVGGAAQHYVVLAGGVQPVPEPVAELLRARSAARVYRPVSVELAEAEVRDELPVAGWPVVAPRLREAGSAPVLCWVWTADGTAGGVWLGDALPAPDGVAPVLLPPVGRAADRVDAAVLGVGGAVRSVGGSVGGPVGGNAAEGAGSAGRLGRGAGGGSVAEPGADAEPVWLVSSTGVCYPVADAATAAAVGVTATEPAPAAILRLLPTGPTLDLADAARQLGLPSAPK